ncbi:hypothetical protein OC861_000621 [Tilletia horrida]|nr:hypothetical protein OC845_000770 [Tilletia horrida]KAK0569784.1 hypothetical protein OC861_000621 [Tilletia horrida]
MRSSTFLASSVAAAILAFVTPSEATVGRGVPKDLYLKARADGSYQDLYNRNGPSHNNRLIPRNSKQHAKNAANVKRQATQTNALGLSFPTDEAGFAKVTDDRIACNYYYLPDVANIQNNYPTPWLNGATTGATLLSSDSEGQSVWKSISSGIPNIPVRSGAQGVLNFNGYNQQQDPDCWWSASQCHTPKQSGIPQDVYNCPEPSTWGLTFDDGPNCTHNAFYDFLEKNNQKATLYYIGSNVLDWPLQAQRGLADGHQICIHTWSHQLMTTLQSENVFAELWYTAKIIKDIVGVAPRCWRPPYGDVDDRVRYIANAMGLATHIWTDDTNDYDIAPLGPSPTAAISASYSAIIATGTASPNEGIIVLTHEINGYTMALFESEYSNIIKNFKHVVPLTACLNESNPYEPNSGISYPGFNDYIAGKIQPSGIPSTFTIKDQAYNPISISAAAASMSSTSASSGTKSTSKASTSTTSTQKGSATSVSLGSAPAVLFGLAASTILGGAFLLF